MRALLRLRPSSWGAGCAGASRAVRARAASTGAAGPGPARGLVDESGADTEDEAAARARTELHGTAPSAARRRRGGGASSGPSGGAPSSRHSGAAPDLASLSPLTSSPYSPSPSQQPGQAAPLWMLYEAQREEARWSGGGGDARARLVDNAAAVVRGGAAARDDSGRAYATGRRKEAVARVWVSAGDGAVRANGGALADALPRLSDRAHALEPLVVTQTAGAVDVLLTCKGGGLRGQAGAVRHGLANALAAYDPALKPALRRCA
jgi:small subunit ribosomal protein S9